MSDDLLTDVAARKQEIAPLDPSPVAATPASMMQVIARATTDPRVDVQKMEALLRMQEKLVANQARADFNAAMARLQPRLPRVRKNGTVAYKGGAAFRYAKWEDIDAAIRDLLNDEGFSLSFNTTAEPGGIVVTGTLRHSSGHAETSSIGPLPPDTGGGKNAVQAVGSTTSYGKRYTATNLLNLTFEGEDDDGAGGVSAFIDDASIKALADLIEETGTDLGRFLRFMGAASLSDIQANEYGTAINALMAKRKQAREGTL